MVLERTNHNNIVKMIDRMRSKNSYYLILEYCNGGDLNSFMMLKGKLSEEEGRLVIKQIIEGMIYMNSIKVIHRDLKLANILIHFPGMVGTEN